ncbi:DUF6745 domain-containing protein [Nonomuraea typhae]|uniref:DUF6745 domain-containing protein n=1 Tax=Nonomuraea typhae TaxID=2603600 RepID=UPI001CA5DF53|nr:hypothetical protein [Nonomuraea typhae]
MTDILSLDAEAALVRAASAWETTAFATGPAARAEAESAVRAAYRAAGLPGPERILWFGSPARAAVAAAVLSGGAEAVATLTAAGLNALVTEILTRLTTTDVHTPGRPVRDLVRTRPWEAARAKAAAALGPAAWSRVWALTGGHLWPDVNRLTTQLRTAIGDQAAPGVRDAGVPDAGVAVTGADPTVAVAGQPGPSAAGQRPGGAGQPGPGAAGQLTGGTGVGRGEQPTDEAVEEAERLLRQATLDAVLGQHEAAWLSTFDGLEQLTATTTWDPGEGRASAVGRVPRGGGEAVALEAVAQVARAAGWWWPFERVALMSERPVCLHRDDLGRLHRADGPAMAYPDGFALHAWHGMPVPSWFGETMTGLDAKRIASERNAELRRAMVEHYGIDRYLAESGARPTHRDATGVLWRVDMPDDEPIVTVEVINATPEPDGTSRTYFLRVPPWVQTARQGVAWTFGLTEETYQPDQET